MDKHNRKTVILVIVLIIFAGLIYVMPAKPKIDKSDYSSLEVYYFYLETCPSCQAVKPYITYLENKYPNIAFQKYELMQEEGIDKFDYYSEKFNNVDRGVPFAVLISDKEERSFLGRIEILELEKTITEKLELPTPAKTYEVPDSMRDDCNECHLNRNLAPPSTYTCEYCCHGP